MPVSVDPSRPALHLRRVGTSESDAVLLALPEVRFGLGCAGIFAATGVCVGLHVPSPVTGLVLLVLTGASARRLRGLAAALLTGVTGWAFCTGFAVNQLGDLTFRLSDVARLIVYVVVALTCRWWGRHNGGVRAEEAGCGEARSVHGVVPGGTESRWSPRC